MLRCVFLLSDCLHDNPCTNRVDETSQKVRPMYCNNNCVKTRIFEVALDPVFVSVFRVGFDSLCVCVDVEGFLFLLLYLCLLSWPGGKVFVRMEDVIQKLHFRDNLEKFEQVQTDSIYSVEVLVSE